MILATWVVDVVNKLTKCRHREVLFFKIEDILCNRMRSIGNIFASYVRLIAVTLTRRNGGGIRFCYRFKRPLSPKQAMLEVSYLDIRDSA